MKNDINIETENVIKILIAEIASLKTETLLNRMLIKNLAAIVFGSKSAEAFAAVEELRATFDLNHLQELLTRLSVESSEFQDEIATLLKK